MTPQEAKDFRPVAALLIMHALISNSSVTRIDVDATALAKKAVEQADTLIKVLK
jgi:hypothetical protein